jgi:hypothetical protein
MLASEGNELITEVRVTDDELVVSLADGRTLAVPLVWYPRLLNASAAERSDWELIGYGEGVHWPQIDEDLSAEGMLRGIPASPARFKHPSSQDDLRQEKGEQYVRRAKDFYGEALGTLKGQLQSDRAQLESLAGLIPGEEAQAQIQEMVDSYEAIESALDQSAQDLGIEEAVDQALQQAQEAAGGAVQQAQDGAQGITQQVQEAVEGSAQHAQETAARTAQQAQDVVAQGVEQARTVRQVRAPKKKGVHVTPRGNKWAVIREGNQRATSLHDTQKQAEKKGRETARRDKTEFYLHNQQGAIRERDSYGSDPRSSKG